ncbi:MAG: MogA/MoaB family molybdenum cofactor biosynthesis protein [Deltaproteobacteria bacterium]|jgi:molybdenum cofactor synthesis domain-containing protein|nr:MogA/MoaB family molybdenum cofactor biosynthesis protein [Deltaproteobacteria bacterium]
MGTYRAAVITASDKGSEGLREDKSGRIVFEMLVEAGYEVVSRSILPDERDKLSAAMLKLCDSGKIDLIVTTGGTGFSPRDYTPEATLDICHRQAPGLAELMRAEGLKKTPRAMLSRGVAAIRGRTLIINLPGSPKGASENLGAVLPILDHGLEVLTDKGGECAQP